MAIELTINGTGVADGGTYKVLRPGEKLNFRCIISNSPGQPPIAARGPWVYEFYLQEKRQILNPDPEKPVLLRDYRFEKELPLGTHTLIVGVSSASSGISEIITITIDNGKEVTPRTTLIVKIDKPAANEHYIEMKKNTEGQWYHEPAEFSCSIEGGKPPYRVVWRSRSRANEVPFGSDLVTLSDTETRASEAGFSLGGSTHPPRGGRRVGTLGDPKSSLPPGDHEIVVGVWDSSRPRQARQDVIHLTVGTELQGRLTPYGVMSNKRPSGVPPDFYRPAGPAERAAGGVRAALSVGQKDREGKTGIQRSKERADQEIGQRRNPAVRAGINAGIVQLNKMGPRLSQDLIDSYIRQMKELEKKWDDAKKDWLKAKKDVKDFLRAGAGGGPMGGKVAGLMPNFSAAGAVESLTKSLGGSSDAHANILRDELKFAYDHFTKMEGEVTDFYTKSMDDLEKKIYERLEPYAESISRQQARRLGLNDVSREEVEAALKAEITELAASLAKNGKARMRGIFGAVRRFSMGSQTLSDVYFNIVSQMWEILTGPWVLGLLALGFEYFFVAVPYSGQTYMLLIMGIIGAIGVFILNLEESKAPLDWLTHMISGAMIGLGTGLFLLALIKPFSPGWPENIGSVGPLSGYLLFGIIWFLIALFLGAFQFYQTGGYRPVFQMTVLTIVFAYFALGPYNGYYRATMAPVGSVVVTGFSTVRDAFMDVWLLGTNPTEWYARQQLKNVRPEKPLDYVKGVEIEDLVVIPDSVPASEADVKQEFSVVIIVNNRGDLPAKNIGFSVECNDYCNSNETHISEFKRTLDPGEGDRVQFTNIFSYTPDPDRSAEFQLAKVDVFVSYEYETSSSLNVEIMSKDEINRRQFNQESVYHAVTAVSKSTPAQISLNVGPQPLTAGTKDNRLLVAVLSDRQDGTIVLPAGTEIKLSASRNVIDAMRCTGCQSAAGTLDRIETTCTVPRDTEVKYNEFKSIFAFNCDIDTANTPIARSDIITAEMPQFTFEVKRSKDIAITPPLRPPLSDANKGLFSNADTCKDNQVILNRIGKDPAETYNKYGKYIDSAAAKYLTDAGINGQALIAAIITQESTWNEDSVSSAEAIGLMQIVTVKTQAGGLACQNAGIISGDNDLRDPEKNIECGAYNIANWIKSCGPIEKALTGYYSGQCDETKFEYDDIIMTYYNEWQKCIKFATVKYSWPVEGSQTVSGYCFGDFSETSSGNVHKGIDIAGSSGDAVLAVADGAVDEIIGGCVEGDSGCGGGYGNHVVIEHNDGRFSRYAHLNAASVEKGMLIRKGDVVGTVGNTGISSGPHLHFEVWNEARTPINPCDLVDCSESYCKGGDGTGPVPTCAERFPSLRCYKFQLCTPGTERSPAGTSCDGAFSGDGICCRIG